MVRLKPQIVINNNTIDSKDSKFWSSLLRLCKKHSMEFKIGGGNWIQGWDYRNKDLFTKYLFGEEK